MENSGRPGDINNDGNTNGEDFDLFADCMNGPDVSTPPPDCDPILFALADLEFDADVDVADFAFLQAAFTD